MDVGTVLTGGSLAPYNGSIVTGSTPGANVTYDVNNCVTSAWIKVEDMSWLFKNTIPNSAVACTGGTWTIAGNQQKYDSGGGVGFVKQTLSSGATPTYITLLDFNAESDQTIANVSAVDPYDTVTVSGPGIVTYGNQTTPGLVVMAPNLGQPSWEHVPITDNYYNGSQAIVSCAAIASNNVPYGVGKWVAPSPSTPCFNADLVSGSDLTFKFYIGGTSGTLLATYMSRIYVTPSAVSVPASWYPTITGLNPTSASSFTANVTKSLTINWTLPFGSTFQGAYVELQDINNTIVVGEGFSAAPTATSGTKSFTPTGNAVIGGPQVNGGTGNQFSSVEVYVKIGGVYTSAKNFF